MAVSRAQLQRCANEPGTDRLQGARAEADAGGARSRQLEPAPGARDRTGDLSIECRGCQHVGRPDLNRLIARFGAATLVGAVMRAMVYFRCGSRAAEPLVYRIGIRGDRAWFPQPPRAWR